MTLGETKEFFVLRKIGTEEFFCEPAKTTTELLAAKLIAGRDEVDEFTKLVHQASVSAEQRTANVERVRIRITIERLEK
jgi:hypothetical protein